nr:hypothetical protein [Agreia bicolorata]
MTKVIRMNVSCELSQRENKGRNGQVEQQVAADGTQQEPAKSRFRTSAHDDEAGIPLQIKKAQSRITSHDGTRDIEVRELRANPGHHIGEHPDMRPHAFCNEFVVE